VPKRPTLRDRVNAIASAPPSAWEAAYAGDGSSTPRLAETRLHEAVSPARVPEAERLDRATPDGPLHDLAERTRDAARAQAELVAEWLLAPLWGTGVSSPTALADCYARAGEAFRALTEAYLTATTAWPGGPARPDWRRQR
jgi:CxxC motif-containing protein (DUF1111 family)